MATNDFDYVIVGGGTAGCVLASRLSHAGSSVVVLESGPEEYSDMVMSPTQAPALHATPLEYHYLSTKQEQLRGREIGNYGGHLLSGSSGVNYGNWTRCHSADYDAWAALVGDDRWSYARMLKYFKKTEHHHAPNADREVHGFGGPIHTNALARNYPLREPVRKALLESGIAFNPELNTGSPLGFSAFQENWKDAKRQPAGLAYDLSKATIHTNTTVAKLVIDAATKTTKGAVTIDGRTFTAKKEVLVCGGSVKSPQILMLSGIGPSKHLASHNIPVVADLPVGENLHDHLACTFYWKLKHPEQGLAAGSPGFNDPSFATGLPIEWIVTGSTSQDAISAAAKIDGLPANDPLLTQPRGNFEFFIAYAPLGAPPIFKDKMFAPGTHVATPVLGLLPTSRGSVTLTDTNPETNPIIDPAYYSTAMDRAAQRAGLRAALRAMQDTEAGKSMFEGETAPPGLPGLTSSSTDAELDERVENTAYSFYQCAGTAAMGSVVDGACRVKEIENLRVVDASVLPLPLAGHYQAPVYALAESMADVLLGQE